MKSVDPLIIFFYSIIFFIAVNTLLSLFLWTYRKSRIYALTFYFWVLSGINLGFQFFYPETKEEIVLIYGMGVLPMTFAYAIVCELLNIKGQFKLITVNSILCYMLSFILLYFNASFTASALPLAFALAFPSLLSMKYIFIDKRKDSTTLDKALGFILLLWIIHSFNFALFRMDLETALVGWITSYALFDLLAIILPTTIIVNHSRTEKARLKALVSERTNELSLALQEKENLLKILIHDISNPLTVMRWYLTGIKKAENPTLYIDKIIKSQEIVETIVKTVRNLHINPESQRHTKTSILKCIEEVKFIFEKELEQKNIKFEVIDQSQGDDSFMADTFAFAHHVLGNIVSNAIKFSFPNSTITLYIVRQGDELKLTIKDMGKGMDQSKINEILSSDSVASSRGTNDEIGTGYGLSIVKSMLTQFRAKMEITSKEFGQDVLDHGTTISLSFPAL